MAIAKKRIFSVLTLSAMIASCGGSDSESDDELLTGSFSDSPVGGLSYVTPSTSGVTDADGLFNYKEGETVVFSIGNLALPVVIASEMVTPLDMAATDSVTDPAVVNIARLLQSLDEDGDAENGISIPESAADIFVETAIFDAADDNAVEVVVNQVYGDDRQSVSADQAIAHFVDTLSAETGSEASLEQLQYIVPVGAAFDGGNLFVDEQAFSLSVDGETHTGATTLNHGVYQLTGAEDQWFVSVIEGDDTQLACIAKAPEAVNDCSGDLYHVFTEEQAAVDFSAGRDGIDASDSRADVEDNTEDESGLDIGAATDEDAEVELAIDVADQEAETASNTEDALTEVTLEELFPDCNPRTLDDDGDGFGWEEGQTCLIVAAGVVLAEELNNAAAEAESVAEESSVAEPVVPAPEPAAEVTGPEVTGPEVTEPAIAAAEESTDNNATVEAPAEEVPEITEAPEPAPVATVQAKDITDIIVLTGQGNAAAVQTGYDATLDTGNERLFAFNEDGQWRAADLNQYWDANLPANFSSAAEGREPYNNLAFQIGKSLTEQSDRVVGIIMITASGEGISHWDFNSNFYQQIRTKVNTALAQLPQKTSVDAMIWMQGETDWLAEGTADPGATGFTSTDSEAYINYYPAKLTQLISNLRSEAWYGTEAQFVCGETKKTSLNEHLLALNNDGDDLTSCAAASDLPTRESDPFGNHFSAEALRILGGRIAELFNAGDQ